MKNQTAKEQKCIYVIIEYLYFYFLEEQVRDQVIFY